MYLEHQDWFCVKRWRGIMDRERFGGQGFRKSILWPGMRRLNERLKDLSIYNAALVLVSANDPHGFSQRDLDDRLRHGKLLRRPKRVFGMALKPLYIQGIERRDPDFDDWFGIAVLNTDKLTLNMFSILDWARDPANAWEYPENEIGQIRLQVIVAGVVLHECLHTLGYNHPDRPSGGHDPTHPYYRSLPEVAQTAFLNVHAAYFTNSTPPIGLIGSSARSYATCGVKA